VSAATHCELRMGAICNRAIKNLKSQGCCSPVVQRIERRFPKGKTPLLHQFAQVISNAQTAVLKGVE
jgi:hypothetical protein